MRDQLWKGTAVVYGAPQAMGSKRAFISKKTGRAHVTDEKGAKLKTFQEGMRDAMRDCKPAEPSLAPFSYSLEIVLPRPKDHFGSGKNAGKLKPSAPQLCLTKPDGDKVLRAILDCGTAIWWRDDNQVAMCDGMLKRYANPGEEPHTRIDAREVEDVV